MLFSVVEEERGRDCGKIQSLLLSVRGVGCWRLERGEAPRVGAGGMRWKAVVPIRVSPNSLLYLKKLKIFLFKTFFFN